MILIGPKRKRMTGRFDFCVADLPGGQAYPVGYCMRHFCEGHKEGHHPDPQSALECFVAWCADAAKFDGRLVLLEPCGVCGTPTMSCARTEPGVYSTSTPEPLMPLCSDHLNKDSLVNFLRTARIEGVQTPDLLDEEQPG